MKKIKESKGFTLVELIVVIGILAVLASIAIPNLIGMVEKSKQAKDKANAKLIGDAVTMWIVESQNSDAFNDFAVGHTNNDLQNYLKASFVELPFPKSKKYKGAGYFYVDHDGEGKVRVKTRMYEEGPILYPKLIE